MFVYVVYLVYEYSYYCLTMLNSSDYKKCKWSIYYDDIELEL